jgi:acetate kinase
MSTLLLVLNAGSSSLKFGLYDPTGLICRYRGTADDSPDGGRLEIRDDRRTVHETSLPSRDFQDHALSSLVEWLDRERLTRDVGAVGHRVVHGGVEFTQPLVVDEVSLSRMDRLVMLAPLHLPQNLSAIHWFRRSMPNLPQVACFDTAFHADQSPIVRTYGLPAALTGKGYVRYGFHGLSYEYIASRLSEIFDAGVAQRRIIVAHLGNGASLCGIFRGKSVATTFGYSTLDGLIMGTRCGALDPGLVLQLIRDHDGDADLVERMLYRESGMLGISGLSHDMRTLLTSDDPDARLAIELFVHRIQRECGSLAAALGGLDALVFTGGIGARSDVVRERVCEGLRWLGARIDRDANGEGRTRIEHHRSRVRIAALATDEELVIARHTRNLLARDGRKP